MSNLLRTFVNEPIPPKIIKGEGMWLHLEDGKKYFDMTGGFTAHAVIGWNNKEVNKRISSQLNKITHIDYKAFSDENRETLASLLCSKADHQLDKVFFCGGSGGEACETAMHLSYQAHFEAGDKEKTWFISRNQSYHGATTETMSIGDRPNLEFYRPLYPLNRAKISEHNKYRHKFDNESDDEYSKRCADELEHKILDIGPENVSAFIGETIMGGLVGDVPPSENYWKYIRVVCDKYNVHLIIDEVWCGTGTSGKIYCIDWDQISPDFIFLGKTLGAGYVPISAILTSSKIENIIKNGSGRIENSTTFQGHSLAIAASLGVQSLIHSDGFVEEVNRKGILFRSILQDGLQDHEFFKNVRGRGLRNSVEISCENEHLFGLAVTERMKNEHGILINGKWHRFTFSNAMIISDQEIQWSLDKFLTCFKDEASKWNSDRAKQIKEKQFF
tara:strand:+ start:2205 stop:3539 length:1335 start_codon:yes stop_codon:yes gene_type:complete